MNGYFQYGQSQQGYTNLSYAADDDSDYYSEAQDADVNSDDGVLKPRTHDLGLSRDYVPYWTSEDAFREFYQNWKDAIINSFDLDARSFTPILEETPSQIQIRVYKNSTAEDGFGEVKSDLCGFILYNKKAGSVELTNFRARLDLEHLSLGGTSKRSNDKFAGYHGEGFKLAALVLRRNDHSVRIAASSFYWNFGFRRREPPHLYCRLSQAKPEKVEQLKKRYIAKLSRPGFKRDLSANLWEDVTVKIAKGRDEGGLVVQEDEFRSWLLVTLDLNPPAPAEVIKTDHGDLLLDSRFAGSTYLKGLRVAGNGQEYAYGYNFAHGRINRDRDRIADAKHEQTVLREIWQAAISIKGAPIIDLYLQLLGEDKDCVEVTWTCDKMDLPTVKTIWRHMRSSKKDAYFYFEDTAPAKSKSEKLIKSDLNKSPVLMPEKLFKLLKKSSLIQTPEEERRRLFETSQPMTVDSDFGRNVVRALYASLSLSEKLKSIHMAFVDGGGTDQDFSFEKELQLIRVHQKWVDFQKIHHRYPCETQRLPPEEQPDPKAFFCDHVVEDLLDILLPELSTSLEIDVMERRSHQRLARDGLRLMPRLVQIIQSDQPGTLEVSWIGNESGLVSEKHNKYIRYYVVLHKKSSCKARQKDLIYHNTMTSAGPEINISQQETRQRHSTRQCGCPSQIVSRAESKARFEGLEADQKYFPMVARAEAPSFFGTPPSSIRPRSTPAVCESNSKHRTSLFSSPILQRQNHDLQNNSPSPIRMVTRSQTRAVPQSPTRVVTQSQIQAEIQTSALVDTQTPAWDDDHSDMETNLVDLCEQDEAGWGQWFKEVSLSKLTVRNERLDLQPEHSVASLYCEHLNFCFEKGEYARIQLSDDISSEHPVLIHNILYTEDEVRLDTTYLLVTKYSTMRSTFLFQNRATTTTSPVPQEDKELLLHFEDFDKMGLQDDAELVKLDEITHVSRLFSDTENDYVKYVRRTPTDQDEGLLFCRFAIQRVRTTTEACLTPVASHLLPRPDRWEEPKFPNAAQPVVLDLTPGILGPSEGFAVVGLRIAAGIGFDPQRHMTWMGRNPSSSVYDGLSDQVLQDMNDGLLIPPTEQQHATGPKIAVMASGSAPFRLNDQNHDMPSLTDYLAILEKADNVIQSKVEPDFLVMLSSPALLHPLAAKRFATSLLALLDRRFSVHLKLVSTLEFGLPYKRDILVLIASPLCAPMPWDTTRNFHNVTVRSTVRSLIQDLAFANPRVNSTVSSAFVCMRPDAQESSSATIQSKHVYNHRTGLPTPNPPLWLDWDTEMLTALTTAPKKWCHQSRQDLITVREVARLLGFPDDFIFYLSEAFQYEDVWNSCPPFITKLIGEVLLRVTRGLSAAKMGH